LFRTGILPKKVPLVSDNSIIFLQEFGKRSSCKDLLRGEKCLRGSFETRIPVQCSGQTYVQDQENAKNAFVSKLHIIPEDCQDSDLLQDLPHLSSDDPS
jgi:hypothetical protein